MSEYWKSIPKYWCKHCSTFVRDTKLEKANHEATPKHQGNLKRFLRDLHRGHEKDEKDKQRAKDEVARLTGIAIGSGSGSAGGASSSSSSISHAPTLSKLQATPAQRKQQLAQLAEMGVAIPDEFRPDMAMAGEWQVTSERIVEPDGGEKKPEALALGVRKRAAEEDEEEAEAKKMRWGSRYKTHPAEPDDRDLDALLSNVSSKGKGSAVKPEVKEEVKEELKDEIKKEESPVDVPGVLAQADESSKPAGIKREPSDGESGLPATIPPIDGDIKQEGEEASVPGVVFKKRKAKNIRQK